MFSAIILMSIAYALLALLLLNIGFLSKLNAWLKLALCIATGCFMIVHFHVLRDMLGWPTQSPLPHRFLLLAAEINEPDKETGANGSIYLWATEIIDREPVGEPRAYELPYHQPLHEKLNVAKNGQRKGIPQIGQVPERKAALFSIKTTTALVEEIEIVELPDPVLPEK